MLHFFLKKKKRGKDNEIGNFGSFFALSQPSLKNLNIKVFKNEKICCSYHYFTHVYKNRNHMTKFFCHFLPFYLPKMIPKIKILTKMKKTTGDIIILYIHVYHKWMIYGSWIIRCKQQRNVLSFWAFFILFIPQPAQIITISKKWKKHQEISSSYKCVPKIMIRWCMVPEI